VINGSSNAPAVNITDQTSIEKMWSTFNIDYLFNKFKFILILMVQTCIKKPDTFSLLISSFRTDSLT